MSEPSVPHGTWSIDAALEHIHHMLSEHEKHRKDALVDLQEQINRRMEVTERERQLTEKSLKELISAGDEKLQAHIDSQKEAIRVASEVLNERLQAMNKFRESIEKDRLELVRKDEFIARLESMKALLEKSEGNWQTQFGTLTERVNVLNNELTERRGGEQSERRRQQSIQPWHIWLAGAALAILVVVFNTLVPTPTL